MSISVLDDAPIELVKALENYHRDNKRKLRVALKKHHKKWGGDWAMGYMAYLQSFRDSDPEGYYHSKEAAEGYYCAEKEHYLRIEERT